MTESPNIILDFFARTDVGVVRNGNEDNFLVLDLSTGGCITAMDEEPPAVLNTALGQYGVLLAVSDGMGGALAGEVASRMAVETVRDLMLRLQAHPVHGLLPFSERLRVAIEQANEVIHRESLSNPLHKGLGATFTAVASSGAEAYFAQVGDSRAYLIRRGRISRITKDQSLVQQLIDNGQITEEEAETHSYRNVILQALGAHPSVRVEMNTLNLCHHDLLVVCSDGLSGKISEQEILQIVGDTPDLQTSCKLLVDLANERGGEDNITVVIARFASRDLPAARVGEVLPQGLARSAATPTVLNWAETSYIEPGGPLSHGSGEYRHESTRDSSRHPQPSTPATAVPFTSSLRRQPLIQPRTNDLSDRRGPITAVFSISDLDSPDSHGPATEGRASQNGEGKKRRTSSGDRPTTLRRWFYLATFIVAILITIFVGATAFIKRQQNSRQQKEQIDLQNDQKQARIGGLRDKVVELGKKIDFQSIEKPATKARLDALREQLKGISGRIDAAVTGETVSVEQLAETCDEIEREIQKIEDEVDNLQGLLRPSHKTPVRI